MAEERQPVVGIIDDDIAKRYIVAKQLRRAGFEVREGGTGEAALELTRGGLDVLVLDVKLPDVSGLEITRRIKGDPAHSGLMVLLLSASFMTGKDKVIGLESGADAYLTHPVEEPELIATVRALLRIRAAERERSALLRRAEESEQSYRVLTDLIPDIVWSATADGTTDFRNRRWLEYFGIDAGDLHSAQLVHSDDFPDVLQAWEAALATGEPLHIQCRLRAGSGVFRWFLIRAVPVRDTTGAVVRWYGACTEIDAQKQTEATLQETTRFREQVLAIVGHDLRNPLNAISIGAEMLARDANEKQTRVVGRIRSSVGRIARLIELLVDFARTRFGDGLALHPEPLDLGVVLKQVVEEVEVAYPQRQIHLEVSGETQGVWDRERLSQVASNLVTNALKHGSAQAPVRVLLTESGPGLRLEVRNEGTPISPDLLPKIFEPFLGSERPPGGERGMGLGLYIVQQIVLAHGGAIAVESSAEEGTRFWVDLPRSVPNLVVPGALANPDRGQ